MSRGRLSLRLVGLIMLADLLLLVTAAAQAQPLVVYGDESFPPYEFLQNGIPTGANVDLLHELGRVLDRSVEIRLTSWADAQAKVRDGTGDALSLMARTPEREAVYGFSGQTFPVTYSLFVRASDAARFGDAPLATRRIGVTSGGLPRAHFQGQHPDVPLVLMADYIDGVRRLLRGEIDAFAAATWTGNHFLRDLNISGVTPLPEPFAERTSAIAVPRANAALLAEIDRALHQLKRDGTFDRILDRWAGRRVHIVSERELWLAGAAGAATLVAVALLGILLLTTQAKRRALARRFAAHRETEAELRASEDALRRAKVELEALAADLERRVAERTAQLVQAQKMEAVGQLTSGMAHDFNNVLQGVSGCLAGLERRIPDEAARRLFDAAQQGVERGARLTRHMLAFARRQSLTPIPTDVAAMLDGMRPILERSMGGLIRIGVDVPGTTWPALVDPTQLEAAVLNLAINARDAMPLGGLLSVCAANATVTGQGGTGNPTDLRPGDYVVVSVTDTGSGMDEATLARVFEPFFTTKEVGKGSGLGLSMVHGMAVQSGGGVSIASRAGHGTTVSIHLPRADPTAGQQAAPTAGAVRAAGNAVLLLVDDDELVRIGTRALLESLGYRVVEADGGAAALRVLQGGALVDALVTDYAMPTMSGAVLVHEAHRLVPGLPVLLMTGYADRPHGVDGIPLLQKPLRPDELASHLAALVRGGRPANVLLGGVSVLHGYSQTKSTG